MSDRHMHITGCLSGMTGVDRFVGVARTAGPGFFAEVIPLCRDDGTVFAVAFLSKDLDGISDELAMPEIAQALGGILSHDIEIVSAWDAPFDPGHETLIRHYRDRDRVWLVHGRGQAIPCEVIREQAALPPA